jgi:CRP-like cAMP-binding protein
MTEIETMLNYVDRFIKLTPEEQTYFSSLLKIKKLKKKQLIVQPDFVCKHRTYVVKGALRAYLLDFDAKEHTIALAIDDWWISDFGSYIYQQPATLFVEALEESTIITLDYNAEQLLYETVPKFEKFFRLITQRGFATLQQRMLSSLSKTAEERYESFLEKQPLMAARIPQYALASFLGMSTEYFSKLRNSRSTKKS